MVDSVSLALNNMISALLVPERFNMCKMQVGQNRDDGDESGY
jgi:hypothetical protein